MSCILVVILTYNPSHYLLKFVTDLAKIDVKYIIVVNDGSSSDYNSIFELISSISKYIVITIDSNKGKGFALKLGLKHINNNLSDVTTIVTAEADVHHSIKDIFNVAHKYTRYLNTLVLGIRDFTVNLLVFGYKWLLST